jgi:hypothetical protein
MAVQTNNLESASGKTRSSASQSNLGAETANCWTDYLRRTSVCKLDIVVLLEEARNKSQASCPTVKKILAKQKFISFLASYE